jgi:hypothetical protein
MAALGFGIALCATIAECGGFFAFVFGGVACAAAGFGLGAAAARFAAAFLGTTVFAGFAHTFLTLAFGADFFAVAAFESSSFSVNSKAGLGSVRSCGLIRITSAAGFTPAAAAALAAAAVSAACFGLPSMSGLTIT